MEAISKSGPTTGMALLNAAMLVACVVECVVDLRALTVKIYEAVPLFFGINSSATKRPGRMHTQENKKNYKAAAAFVDIRFDKKLKKYLTNESNVAEVYSLNLLQNLLNNNNNNAKKTNSL